MTKLSLLLVWIMGFQALAAQTSPDATVGGHPAGIPPPVAGDAPTGDAQDDAAIERRIEEDSAPLQQLHDAEIQTLVVEEPEPDHLAAAASRLGFESPLRLRVGAAFGREFDVGGAEDQRVPGLPEIDHDLRQLRAEYDIPIDVNEAVVKYVRFFQSLTVRPHFVRWLSRSHRYVPTFREILREEGLPEDTVYLAMIESGFANLATSRAKAVGPWQFIPATAKRFGLRQDFWIDERRDPEKAARAAARFLKELHRETGDWRLAWAGYNAGPGRISRARRLGHSGFWDMARAKRVLPAETRAYVPKLMAAAILAKHAEAFGFSKGEVESERWTEYHEVVVPPVTELSFVAEATRVSLDVLLDLNPELRRTCTPPQPYAIKIPHDKAQEFTRNWPRVSERAAKTAVARHRVRRGETLAAIARAYDVPTVVLASLNRLQPRRRVRAGTVLVIPLGSVTRREAELAASRSAAAVAKVRVRPGDSLWSVARRFDVTVHDLARWNGIRDPGRHNLHAGRVLRVRPKRAPAVHVAKVLHGKQVRHKAAMAASTARTVRVRAGDSLWSLAHHFGVTIHELARWNGIRQPHRHVLHAGRLLIVRPRAASARGGHPDRWAH